MNKNDIFDLIITDMGVDGEGIGKYGGMTFFVKDALIGDEIRARVTKLKKNYGYARVEEIVKPSPDRVTPRCPHHKRCGGCQIQALAYDKQLAFKEKKVRDNLIRIGAFSEEKINEVLQPVIGMDEPFRYRNKAQFPVGRDRDGSVVTGFYAARTHSIIPVEDCVLGIPENRVILDVVRRWMELNGIEPYDETTGTGLVRHVLIRYGFSTNEIMVCLIVNGEKLPHSETLVDSLCKMEGMTSISFNVNTERTNVILGSRTECIWGTPYITDFISLEEDVSARNSAADGRMDFSAGEDCPDPVDEGLKPSSFRRAVAYRISPQSFYQVNPIQTGKLYRIALEYAGLTGCECVWDLYCGIGTISLFLSQKARKVYGVEIVPQAIEDARENARLNGITNAEFFVGKAEEILPQFYAGNSLRSDLTGELAGTGTLHGNGIDKDDADKDGTDKGGADMAHPDVIVVDPPRKGCERVCLDTMLAMRPQRIVYVSCDSATLARDLRILVDGGYELEKVQPVDQFCHTGHVETVVGLQRIDT